MTQSIEDESMIRRYLLGELAEEEQQRLEERLLTDDAYYEQLLAIEDELTDEYARGALSKNESDKFERRFLSTAERREGLRFALALKKYTAAHGAVENRGQEAAIRKQRLTWLQPHPGEARIRRPLFGLSLAAILLITMLGGIWLIRSLRGDGSPQMAQQPAASPTSQPYSPTQDDLPPEPVNSANAPANTAQQNNGSGQQNTSDSQPAQPRAIVAVSLSPGLLRDGGETQRLILPPGPRDVVRFQLLLAEDEHQSYRAELLTAEGKTILVRDALRSTSKTSGSIILNIPARSLAPGDYQIRLRGRTTPGQLEDIARYHFRALKN